LEAEFLEEEVVVVVGGGGGGEWELFVVYLSLYNPGKG